MNLLLGSLAFCALFLLSAADARATEPSPQGAGQAEHDESSFGTTPARSNAQPEMYTASDDEDRPYDGDRRTSQNAPIATDPPGDWAVLHAGLRPKLGTFGGIATLALVHARTERFYGGLSLSLVRNDAGMHIGLAQVALGRNLSDSFGGGVQLSITENRARHFIGIGQTALAYNRSLTFTGGTQLAAFNRAKDFTGVAQLGLYNRTDESFAGVTQLGVFNHSRASFAGLAQVGAVSFTSNDFRGLVQLGALGAGAGSFHGLAQIAPLAMSKESMGLQIGGAAIALGEHTGIQLSALVTYARAIDGAQIGVANVAKRVRGVQIGVFNYATSLRGVQIGLVNHSDDGVLPWTALLNFGFGDGVGDTLDDDDSREQVGAHRTSFDRF